MLMQLFSRFVSEPVVRELWKQRQAFFSGGRPRPQELTATVLFSDIVGFTPICEKLAAAPLIAWLDAYIDTMVQVVIAHDGVVLRFIGDGILAVFGAPVPRSSDAEISADARNAAQCALSMAAAMRRLNDGWRGEGLPTAAVRVGIYTGPLVAGSLGSGSHMEYCLLGDTANTAARLEAAGKAHSRGPEDSIILVGEPTMERLGDVFAAESVGELNLRGKERPVSVYRIIADG
jgi:class 3 adenylate cyclase